MSLRIVVTFLFLVAFASCNKWSRARVKETMRRGDTVCHAIEVYRTKTGKYPFELKELQPEFLREIPQPTAGNKAWDYMLLDDGREYWLRVVGSEWGPQLDIESGRSWSYLKGEK